MMTFLSQSDLPKGGLRLYLSNDLGQPQDAISVKWSVFSMVTGDCVSGRGLPAVKADTGQYYAPWFSDTKSGSYKVIWEIQDNWGQPSRSFEQPFFVVEYNDYALGVVGFQGDKAPAPGGLTFKTGSYLGPNDLFIVLRDENNIPCDAYAVTWYIQDSHGRAITQRAFGAPSVNVGCYYAPWVVSTSTGSFRIVWEYQRDRDSPLQSASQAFTVLGNVAPFMLVVDRGHPPVIVTGYDKYCRQDARKLSGAPVAWGSSPVYCGTPGDVPVIPLSLPTTRPYPSRSGGYICSSVTPPVLVPTNPRSCSSFEVTRQVHIQTGPLPDSGSFTTQNAFPIPTGIRKFAFYVTYSRGAERGYPVFRLLWGNGVEETPETVLDSDINPGGSPFVSQNLFVQDLYGPTPVSDDPVTFVLYASTPGGATTVRLIAAEKGVPATPGTIGITLTAST